MSRQIQYDARWFRWGTIGLAAWLGALLGATPGRAADIVRVEEDWELVVATPDPASDGPQVTCLVSPTGDVSSLHAAFDLNHYSLDSFAPGGLQLQLWNGESPVSHVQSAATGVLQTANETITWTQVVAVSGGTLTFQVANGQSTTWGAFGGSELSIQVPTTLTNLNLYAPTVSVGNSAVGYAANRVSYLALLRVRYTDAAGNVTQDDTVRVIPTL